MAIASTSINNPGKASGCTTTAVLAGGSLPKIRNRCEHIHKLGGVRDVAVNLDDILEAAAGCRENAFDIIETLARL